MCVALHSINPAPSQELTAGSSAVETMRLKRVLEQAGQDSTDAAEMLKELVDIGPRLTGSKQEGEATGWALGQMKRIGLTRVHAERWSLARGWTRGHARARTLNGAGQEKPAGRTLDVRSLGWTGSTKGPVEGTLVAVHATDLGALVWKGNILLVEPGANPSADFFAMPLLVKRAQHAGAVAVLVADERAGPAHTGPLSFPGETTLLPVLNLAAEEARLLAEQLAASGAPPLRIEVDVSNSFTSHPVIAHNVIGEIAGAGVAADEGGAADEVVLVGAHLDSWDLSPGATDDGYGVVAVLGAARAIVATGLRPRRTIRIVLFTGEEQGLLGSRAYVRSHASEMDRIVCALVMDWGSGPINKLPVAGHPELDRPLQTILAQTRSALLPGPQLEAPHAVALAKGYLTYTDAFAFTAAGVAGLALLQDSPEYQRIGHSAQDTLGEVDLATLPENRRLLAALCFGLADSPARAATRWTLEQSLAELTRIKAPAGLLVKSYSGR